MSTAQPIRNIDELEAFRRFYLDNEPNLRYYALICLGVNSALRISDLLELRWKDVYDIKEKHFRKHLVTTEKKTGKETRIAINKSTRKGLSRYMESLDDVTGEGYIFPGRYNNTALSRSQAFRIIKHAADILNLENGISCHSMRKTFGYYAWKCGTPPAILMDIYNHSSYEITKRYLGIKQDDKDSVFLKVNL
ncbi:putative uncharacterized protein [Eubacterium sp. CAG:76]|nr:putative uncharacterized protein [Eubacterium sp. CAG:76]